MFHKLEVPVIGIVENMSSYICPECGHEEAIFSVGGGERFAGDSDAPFLGAIPLEPAVREAGDGGAPVVISAPASRSAAAFNAIAEQVARQASIAAVRADNEACAS